MVKRKLSLLISKASGVVAGQMEDLKRHLVMTDSGWAAQA